MTCDDDWRLVDLAWRLDRLRWVPTGVLTEIVLRGGTCRWAPTGSDLPPWDGAALTDCELAALLCDGCPVPEECLELELRASGEQTTGVWGGLPDTDRRALYPHWRQRGERAEPLDLGDTTEGGPQR